MPSSNDYDWLGPGIYFWEANPLRGLEFAKEALRRRGSAPEAAFVVGAIIDLRNCLDLMTSVGIEYMRAAYQNLSQTTNIQLFENTAEKRNLDCAVVRRLHTIQQEARLEPFHTIRGLYIEGKELYPGSGFREKTHIQIAVNDPSSMIGLFRVHSRYLSGPMTTAARPRKYFKIVGRF